MNLSNPDGVLLVDKASGMTSHDVVAITRRALNTKKVGHCGTLDPLATGLLIIVLGRGTKIQDLLMSEDKEYVGTMTLGVTTDSQDADGQVVETKPVPEFTREQMDAAFAKYHGDFYQMPPMVSAIKKDGVPLYKLARQGKVVEREPRFVHVYAHEIQSIRLPEVDFSSRLQQRFLRSYLCFRHRHGAGLRRSSKEPPPDQIRAVHPRTCDHRGRAQDARSGRNQRADPESADRLADARRLSRGAMQLLRNVSELAYVPGTGGARQSVSSTGCIWGTRL
jgi:tRNA pseudouridine55 synthase